MSGNTQVIFMKHTVALSGSYQGADTEKLFKSLPRDGILRMSLIGREITIQTHGDNLDEIKKSLGQLGVDNINVLEWKKAGVTLSNPGRGCDRDEVMIISLIPSALDCGLRPLALLCEFDIGEETLEKIRSKIEDMLSHAGITDVIYTIHIKKETDEKTYLDSTALGTLNAIFDAGGVIGIEQ